MTRHRRHSRANMKSRITLLALVAFTALTCVSWTPEDAGIKLSDPEVVNYHGTVIRPVKNEALPHGKNVLWCATFQMAWDAATKSLGGPLRLQPASPVADSLNRGPFKKDWIDQESITIAGGSVADGVLDRIDQGARARNMVSELTDELRKISAPDDLVFHALLKKDLEFEKPFARLGKWKVGKRSVPWFGFTPEQKGTAPLKQQVGVHRYAAKDDFVIELFSKQTDDQLILAKLPKAPASVADLSRTVLGNVVAKPEPAEPADLLAVPNLVADETVSFSELEGKTVVGTGRFIRAAKQTIDFRMDEKGVKLRSEATLSLGCSANIRVEPRLMILDPPFAVLMKRKGAPEPYFVAWIANTDLLGGD